MNDDERDRRIAKIELHRSAAGVYRVIWRQEYPDCTPAMIDGYTSLGAVFDEMGRRIARALRDRKVEP